MDNLLEQQRHCHEEIERIEKAIVQQYMSETPTHKDQLVRDHIICQYLERIQAKSQELTRVYNGDDGALAKAIANSMGPDEFRKFYDQLTAINDYHRRYPNELVEPMELQFAREQADWERQKDNNDTVVDKVFSGEEGMGRYLDLYEQFEQYVNLKNVPKMDYLQYLRELDNFASISPASKTQLYRDYLTSLVHYLEGYFDRALPLFNLQALQSRVEADFNAAWRKRSVPGWEDAPDYQALFPLYCYACRKQYTKQTVYDAHLKGRKHQKATRALEHQQSNPTEPAAVRQAQQQTIDELDAKRKTMALLEALLTGYLEQLGDKRENTRANIERKQALTEEERRAELQEDDDVDVNQYESDEEDQIYNPLNLPLDWDGKPIPYWLYKLHGLRVNYACEICGNYTYRGRKAFDKHFQEWRHLHGLRCLNIRANRQFYGITSIADAQALWDKIKAEEKSEEVQLNQAEEYEDNQGNVFNKKTYEDLKRQGLL